MMTIGRQRLFQSAFLIIFLVAAFVTKLDFAIAAGQWDDLFNDPFHPPENLFVREMVWDHMKTFSFKRIKAMEGFKEKLYALVGGSSETKLYRLHNLGCEFWTDVTPQWNQNIDTYHGGAMTIYNGSLYIGTACGGNGNGEIFKTTDGSNWQHAEGNIPIISNIYDMIVFNERLYVSGAMDDGTSQAPIWSTDGDGTWEPAIVQPDGGLSTLEVYNGYIYGGRGLNNSDGIEIWRSSDGEHWELFRFYGPTDDTFAGSYPGHVHAMKTFKNHLYIGMYHGFLYDLIRTDGTPSSWEFIKVLTGYHGLGVVAMEEHKGRLYVGLKGADHVPLFESENGEDWTRVDGQDVQVSDFDSVFSLKSFQDRLFVGSESTSDNFDNAYIYNYGEAPAPECLPIDNYWDVFDQLLIVPINIDLVKKSAGNPFRNDWMLPSIRKAMDATQALDDDPQTAQLKYYILSRLDVVNLEIKKALTGPPANAENHFDKALKACMEILAANPK